MYSCAIFVIDRCNREVDNYDVSVRVNLLDSDMVFAEYRGKRISRIWTRYLQSIGVSVQENRARVPYLTCTVPMTLSRARFVCARRARSA